MSFYHFLFSNKRSTKILRHCLFWFSWLSMYALIQAIRRIEYLGFIPSRAILHSYFEMLLQLPIDILFVYWVIYFLVPRFLMKNHLKQFFLMWVAGVLFISIFDYYYINMLILPLRKDFGIGIPQQPGFLLSVLSISLAFNMEAGFATAIRLIKTIILQQTETQSVKNTLNRKILENEFYLTQPSTGFFEALMDSIHKLSVKDNSGLQVILHKLKTLSHYVWFEHHKTIIPVETEINSLINYLEIQSSLKDLEYNINLTKSRAFQNQKIIPFVLIPLIEPYFNNQKGNLTGKIAVDIAVTDRNVFSCKVELSDLSLANDLETISHMTLYRKLNLKFPDGFTLTKTLEEKKVMLHLTMRLNKIVS